MIQARIRIGWKWLVRNSAFSGTAHEYTWSLHDNATVFQIDDARKIAERLGGEVEQLIYQTFEPPTIGGSRRAAVASAEKKQVAQRTIAERIAINRRAKRGNRPPFSSHKLV